MFEGRIEILREMFEELNEPVMVTDEFKRVVYANRSAKGSFKQLKKRGGSQTCGEILGCGRECRDGGCLLETMIKNGAPRATRKFLFGGRELEVSAYPWYRGGRIYGSVLVCPADAAGAADREALRRKVEAELKSGEERYRIVADFTYDWEYWISPEDKMLYVSPSCERISGRKPAEFIADTGLFFEIMHPSDRRRTAMYIEKVSKRGGVCETDFRIVRPDGDIRWIHHISQPVFSAEGKALGRRASNRDITERKFMEDEILQKEERYRMVADFTYDWEYWMSPDGDMLYVSPSCQRISGHPPEDFINDPGLFEKLIHPSDRRRAISYMEKFSNKPGICETEFRIVRPDGDERWIHHISQPVYSSDGRPLGRRASNRDSTARKQAEHDLALSRKELVEKNAELEQKNVALKEVLGRIEIEKKEYGDNIVLNAEKILMPLLNELSVGAGAREKASIELLQKNLREITSSFGSRISEKSLRLTPKEIKICNMIKSGMTSKEIADVLKISVRTAETHRNNIRKKLGLANEEVNLATYLQNYFMM